MTDHPRVKGLRGPSPLFRQLALGASPHAPPADYQPAERGYPNLMHVRYWRAQPKNSCVGHGVVQAVEVGCVRHGISLAEALARLHAYSLGLEQQTPIGQHLQDEGTYIDRVLYAVQTVGVCAERLFPPDVSNVARRPPMEAELEGYTRARGDFWQLNSRREICYALDTFGAVVVGKLVGAVYEDHAGNGTLPPPGPNERALGGHCTVLLGYENFGATLIECNSWNGWGYSQGVVGDDGVTRQIHSLARLDARWCEHPWWMNAYAWVPGKVAA